MIVADKNTVDADTKIDGVSVLDMLKENTGDDTLESVNIVVQQYMSVDVVKAVGANDEGNTSKKDSLTLDIKAMAQTVATKDLEENEKIVTDASEGGSVNAVEVGEPVELTVTAPVTVTVPMDATFATGLGENAWVKHTAKTGVYYYQLTVETVAGNEQIKTVSFVNPNGFSEFEFSSENTPAAVLDGMGYETLQAAVNAAKSGDTITVYRENLTATITGAKTVKIVDADESGENAASVVMKNVYGSVIKGNEDGTYTGIAQYVGGFGGGGSAEVVDPSNSVTVENKDGASAVVTTNEDGTVTAEVTVPEGVEKTTIVIPVENLTSGMVAKDADGKIVKLSVPTEDGLAVTVGESTTLTIVDNSRDFADVAEDYWGADSIAFASAHELFKSTGDGVSFEPELELSRYMLMTILARLDDQDINDTGAEWYVDGMKWAVETGISDGYNGTRNVTREEMVTMLWRYAGKPAADENGKSINDFADADSVMEYAKDAMAWAVSVGIINGGDNGIDPQGDATRAQVAAVMERYCALLTK
jgi:hypothetical protein